MFCLTVAVGNIPWALMFKTEEGATVALDNATLQTAMGACVTLQDDFGQVLRTQIGNIKGVMLEDMDKSQLAHIERALHHARMQAKGQQMAQADATLRAGQHGPGIITPMGMPNGFPRQ